MTVTLPQSTHYNVAYKTITVTINKIANRDSLRNNILATYGDTLSLYELPTSATGSWSWQEGGDTKVGVVGTQTHVALFSPFDTKNYATRNVGIFFIVDKQVVQLPMIEAKTYDGTTLTADVATTEVYRVTTNNGGVEIGSYDVVLELVDSDNYRWAGKDTETTVTLKFDILRNVNNKWKVAPIVESFEYGTSTVRFAAEPENGECYVTFVEKETGRSLVRPTNVGDYLVTFYVPETENYSGLEAV
jgi:hypothetical protein